MGDDQRILRSLCQELLLQHFGRPGMFGPAPYYEASCFGVLAAWDVVCSQAGHSKTWLEVWRSYDEQHASVYQTCISERVRAELGMPPLARLSDALRTSSLEGAKEVAIAAARIAELVGGPLSNGPFDGFDRIDELIRSAQTWRATVMFDPWRMDGFMWSILLVRTSLQFHDQPYMRFTAKYHEELTKYVAEYREEIPGHDQHPGIGDFGHAVGVRRCLPIPYDTHDRTTQNHVTPYIKQAAERLCLL